MNILFHKYRLSKRVGALLKVVFRDGKTGYADCHPWPELGDLPLKVQLAGLSCGKLTSLTTQSLKFARIDAEGRAAEKNLLTSLKVPDSHYLLMKLSPLSAGEVKQACGEGFTHFKVKVGASFSEELKLLEPLFKIPNTRWRLDFNNRLKMKDRPLLTALHASSIEFIEDPFPFGNGWYEFPFSIACDRQEDAKQDAYCFKVCKPAVEDRINADKPLVVTSYLGHPIGQVADAFTAGKLSETHDIRICGLLSHRVYPRNLFSKQLSWQGPEWKNPEGTGFGFDELLTSINWMKL